MFRFDRVPTIALLIALGIAASLRAEPAALHVAASQPAGRPQASDAERIVRLEETIAHNEQELAVLKAKLEDPDSEYGQAKSEFTEIDRNLKEIEKTLKQATASQPATSQPVTPLPGGKIEEAREQVESVRKQWMLAKERFDLAIREDTAGRSKLAALDEKLQQDREALAKMRNPEPAASQPVAAAPLPQVPPPARAGAVTEASMIGAVTGVPVAAAPASPAAASAAPRAVAPTPAEGSVAASPAAAVPPAPPVPAARETPPPSTTGAQQAPPSKELIAAQQTAQAKQVQAVQAEQEVQSISQRIATLRGSIKTENELLQTAREKALNAKQTRDLLRSEIQTRIKDAAPVEEVARLWNRADQAEARAARAESDVDVHINRMEDLRVELDSLQGENIVALEQAEQKRTEASEAEKKVRQLENPFAPMNLLQWLLDHGPRIVGIVLSMVVLWWLTRLAEGRIAAFISRGYDPEHSPLEREARARTLASVFRNTASTVIVVGSLLMILTEVSINVLPLLGGAAVVGLAVAFGAQALIKDYFSGFIILLENQYAINDVIKIGDTTGLVERISLRMTVLRDLEGNAHFVPHGEVKQVTNMTHGWSRALFAIGVAYKEPVDRVMQVLMDLGEELCKDPKFRPLVLDGPEMLGVDTFGASEIVIKFMIKTRPLEQWAVKRELLRRIKNRFDELGIEIPFPHRTIYHRYEASGASEPVPLSPSHAGSESLG